MTTMTDVERTEMLKGLGLNPEAPGLAALPAKVQARRPSIIEQVEANEDLHTMSPTEIVFDPSMLDQFESLDGANMAAASRMLFDLYKSPTKNRDRHALLHRRIGEFIQQVRRSRQTVGLVEPVVREKVKASKEVRDLAALLEAQGITAAELAALIKSKGESA